MAEATSITFKALNVTDVYKKAYVTAVSTATETITLSDEEYQVNTIKKVTAHVAATGVPITYSYATNVLTRTTAGTDVSDVIEILYI